MRNYRDPGLVVIKSGIYLHFLPAKGRGFWTLSLICGSAFEEEFADNNIYQTDCVA
jgi:hypothetical protein